ncbi:LamG-like jellyroll fold domain-containing protein [Marivirga salinae]|uniref:LamG-like jellyroll fold domain-containing protein n=1 Tax=Marivirga salinarum TaxID=3059078 RepID=A0AA51R872_9BACT|nr:LamG-like jellyroll fold domain-containing protein [Marivirga sp. BDSF4-3]WMN10877.1 LamG-like jellyroll fold domain-containing protein [Marivirga sp. BDSF4-3]
MRILFTLIFTLLLTIVYGQNECSDSNIEEELIAHYPLDNNGVEVLGSGFNGEINGAIPTNDINGNRNSAYLFDGIDDYIHIGDHFDLGDSDFTISCWVNVFEFKGLIDGTSSRGGWMVNKGGTIFGSPRRSGYGLDARKLNGQNHFYFMVGGQNDDLYNVKGLGFKENVWYHLMGIKNDDSISLFVDNVLIATEAIPANMNVNTNIPLVFGSTDKLGYDQKGTTFFNGIIDDVKIYKTALSKDERACLIYGCIPPQINLGEDQTICNETSIILDASGSGFNYKWQDGSTNPTFEVTKTGTYWVEVENSCGIKRDTIKLVLPEIRDLTIPNVITPNQDGYNDYFVVDSRLLGSTLKIFQRHGKKVYESANYNNEWDGGNLPSAAYYWIITNDCGTNYKGWLRIIY